MSRFNRRGFVQSLGATSLALGAMNARGFAADDPFYSTVDPELAAALKKFPQSSEPLSAANLAAARAGDSNDTLLSAPELQPRRATVPGPVGLEEVPVVIIDPKPGQKNRPAILYIHGG